MEQAELGAFEEFVRVLAEELRREEGDLAKGSITSFREFVNALGRQAQNEFLFRSGLKSLMGMSPEEMGQFSKTLVVSLNRVLPLTHPYAVVFILASSSSFIGAMERRLIPGVHDLLTPGLFLVLKLRGEHVIGENIQKLNITDAEFRN